MRDGRLKVALCAALLVLGAGCSAKPMMGDTGGPQIRTGENSGGTIGNSVPATAAVAGVQPPDQNAPLDFSNQPKSVPHTYAGGRIYNVQVLKHDYSYVLGQMVYYTQSLGVNCQYCHVSANFAYDTPMKKLARTMLVMTTKVQSEHIDLVHKAFPKYAINGEVGCETCHRGAPQIAVRYNVVPVQYLDYPAKSTRQAGFVVNSMYSAAKSLGVSCLFCHNSADFVTLQYYPTNQIAHRMWRMVDAINHQYLPANVPAVTCYTCHQGQKWPNALVAGGADQTPVKASAAYPDVHLNPGATTGTGGS